MVGLLNITINDLLCLYIWFTIHTLFLRLGHVSAGCVVLYRADIVLQDEELKIMLGNGFFYRLLVSGGRN